MSICPHCEHHDADHDRTVSDDGRVVSYCPTDRKEPATPTDEAVARIREIRDRLREAG